MIDRIMYSNKKQVEEARKSIESKIDGLCEQVKQYLDLQEKYNALEKKYNDLSLDNQEKIKKIQKLETTIRTHNIKETISNENVFQDSLAKFEKLFSEIEDSVTHYEGTHTKELLEFVYNLFVNKNQPQYVSMPYELFNVCKEIKNNFEQQSAKTFETIMSFTKKEMKDIIIKPEIGETYNPNKHEYRFDRKQVIDPKKQTCAISDVITLGYQVGTKVKKALVKIEPKITIPKEQPHGENERMSRGNVFNDGTTTINTDASPKGFNSYECDKPFETIGSNNKKEEDNNDR